MYSWASLLHSLGHNNDQSTGIQEKLPPKRQIVPFHPTWAALLYPGQVKRHSLPFQPVAALEYLVIKYDFVHVYSTRQKYSAPWSPSLVFLRYLLNKSKYQRKTFSTLSRINFTHYVKI